jgi:hypothetical protein
VALVTFVVGTVALEETRHIRIWDELHGHASPKRGFDVVPPPRD